MTFLDHEHREGEYVCFRANYITHQDLRRSPPRGESRHIRVTLYRILIFHEYSLAKIGDACMTGVVHEDVKLIGYQYGGAARFRMTTYSFDAPMNNFA